MRKPIGTRSQNGYKPSSEFVHSFKKPAVFLAALLVFQMPVAVLASPTNLNLQSTTTADKAAFSGTVKEGNHTVNVTAGTSVTPAVDAALIQEHTTGNQALVINHNGVATGGSLALSNALYGVISTVVIPSHVTGNINTATSPVLAVTGLFQNLGTINIIGHVGSTATIAAGSLINSGQISTGQGVNLHILALTSVTNSGSIISGGSLLVGAPTVTNSANGLLQACGNATIAANVFSNPGTLESLRGNVFALVNSLDNKGVIEALRGSVLITDAGANTLSITGNGDITAKHKIVIADLQNDSTVSIKDVSLAANRIVLLTGKNGILDANVGELDGKVSFKAGSATLDVKNGNLDVRKGDVTNGSLSVDVKNGNFVDYGKITVNASCGGGTADITANNILIKGSINTGDHVNLVLKASNDITNKGKVHSGGTLKETAKTIDNSGTMVSKGAGTFIANSFDNSGKVRSKTGDLNFKVNTLNNTGKIKTPKGSITVKDKDSRTLTITGNGIFQAKDTVKFADSRKNSVIDFTDGSVKANNIDFIASTVDVCADELTGNVSLKAHTATVDAEKGNLDLAHAKITSGGLTLIAQDGNVNLESSLFDNKSQTWRVVGGLTILASKNINAECAPEGATIKVVLKKNADGQADMDLEAGVKIAGCCQDASADGSSETGGNVNLRGVSLKAPGGDITVAANGGSKAKGKVKLDNVSISSNKKNADLGTIGIFGQGGISAHDLSASDKADGAHAGSIFMFAENGKLSFDKLTIVGQSGDGTAILGSDKGFKFSKIYVPNGQVAFFSQKDIGVGAGTGQPVVLTNKDLRDVTTGVLGVVSIGEDGGGHIVLHNVDLSKDKTKNFVFVAQNISAEGVKLGDTSLSFEGDDSACGLITLGGITGVGALSVDGFRTIDVQGGEIQICNDPSYHGPGNASGDVSFDSHYGSGEGEHNGNINLYSNVLQAGTLAIDGVTLSDAQANALPYVHHDGGYFLYCNCHFHGGGEGGGGSIGGNSGGTSGRSSSDNFGFLSPLALEIWLSDLSNFHQLPGTDYIHPTPKEKAEQYLEDCNNNKGDDISDDSSNQNQTGSSGQEGPLAPVAFRTPAVPALLERFVVGNGVMNILDGDTLVSAQDATTIKANANATVEVGKHGIAFISLHSGALKVKVLCSPVSVYFTDDNKSNRVAELSVGREITVGKANDKDAIGRRREVKLTTNVAMSEYSIESLLLTSPMLKRIVLLSANKTEAAAAGVIMKNAAAWAVVTNASHGRYMRKLAN